MGPSDEEHEAAKEIISQFAGDKIVFLGHGTTFRLQGAKTDIYTKDDFFTKDDLHLLTDKNLLCLSCKSIDFLRGQDYINCIGFGDLPTQIDEVIGARDFDPNAYQGISLEHLLYFRNLICRVVGNSIIEWLINDYSIPFLYQRIKLRLSKEISALLTLPCELDNRRIVIDLLTEMKNDMDFIRKKR